MTLFDVFDLNSKRYNDGFEFLMSRLSNNYESYNGSTNKSKKKAFIWIKCALKNDLNWFDCNMDIMNYITCHYNLLIYDARFICLWLYCHRIFEVTMKFFSNTWIVHFKHNSNQLWDLSIEEAFINTKRTRFSWKVKCSTIGNIVW